VELKTGIQKFSGMLWLLR